MQHSSVPVGDVSINAALAVLWEAGVNHLLKSPGILKKDQARAGAPFCLEETAPF